MAVASILPRVDFGRNDHREDVPIFKVRVNYFDKFSYDTRPVWSTWNIESNAKEFYQIHANYWLELLVYRKYLFGSKCSAGYQKNSRWHRRIGQFQETILDDTLRYGSKCYHFQIFELTIFLI